MRLPKLKGLSSNAYGTDNMSEQTIQMAPPPIAVLPMFSKDRPFLYSLYFSSTHGTGTGLKQVYTHTRQRTAKGVRPFSMRSLQSAQAYTSNRMAMSM